MKIMTEAPLFGNPRYTVVGDEVVRVGRTEVDSQCKGSCLKVVKRKGIIQRMSKD